MCLVNESSGRHKTPICYDLSEQIGLCLFVHYVASLTLLLMFGSGVGDHVRASL